MSQSLWESDVAEEMQPQIEEKADAPVALSVSVDDFAALEERILRAVNLVKEERQARIAAEAGAAEAEARAIRAEARSAQAEAALQDQAPLLERLQAEIKSLKAERDHVRERVERLLKQLDTLEL